MAQQQQLTEEALQELQAFIEQRGRQENVEPINVGEITEVVGTITDRLEHMYGSHVFVDVFRGLMARHHMSIHNDRLVVPDVVTGQLVEADLPVPMMVDSEDDEDGEEPDLTVRQIVLPTLMLNNTIVNQRMIEQRIAQVTTNANFEVAHDALAEERIADYVVLLQQYLIEIEHNRIYFQHRHDVDRSAACMISLYNFFMVQWSLVTSLSRLRRVRVSNRQLYDEFFRGLAGRMRPTSGVSHVVVEVLNRHSLVALVIPDKFKLYKIFNHTQVEATKAEVMEDREVAVMAFQIRNGRRFRRLLDLLEVNMQTVIDDF